MRTTLTLDDDLASILDQERRKKGMSFKEIVNATLRQGLAQQQALPSAHGVVTRPHSYGFKPGMDLDKLNQLVDELETESFTAGWHQQ
ncbi:MAG: CopG family transcriptional regulator [Candidatus Methylacidiphilales bacterium]